jgi:RNA polymerase sigma-32 factor
MSRNSTRTTSRSTSLSTSRTSTSSAPDGGLNGYLARIRHIPLLRDGEEFELARRYRQRGDRRALDRLVSSHLRLVVKIAAGYRGYGLPASELISEGSIGLMQAAERFDPDKGFRFATYAPWWIRATMHDYIMRSRSLVRIGTTGDQRRLFFNLRKTKASLSLLEDGDLSPGDVARVAARLGVADRDVVEMNRRLVGDVSLNVTFDEDAQSAWQDQLADAAPSQEETLVDQEQLANGRVALAAALTQLNERERRILVSRRLSETPKHLHEIAVEFGVSRERVRQIEMAAFMKVRNAIRRDAEVHRSSPRAVAELAAA